MTKDKQIIAKQDELINALSTYSTHVVIMWNKDLEDDESKDLKLELWHNVKKCREELAQLKAEKEKEVSDEDIEMAAYDYKNSIGSVRYIKEAVHDFIQGAKAHRDNLIKKG